MFNLIKVLDQLAVTNIVCWCGRVEGELLCLERGVILCVGVDVWRGNCRV